MGAHPTSARSLDIDALAVKMSAQLKYPMEFEPGTGDGSAIEIAPGVLWLRMPLFATLPWINVWAIAEAGGWTVVDTGIHTAKTIAAWEAAFCGPLAGGRVVRVVSTHMHPDHCGLAGWLSARFCAPLWMSRLEYLTCRLMAADTGREAPVDGIEFFRASGWDSAALEHYKAKFGHFGEMIYPMPASYKRLSAGDVVQLGAHVWTVVIGNGHSPEHVCLHCPALRLFISGDQVLPRISSNVSVYPTEPEADPLRDWLNSLTRIKQQVPDDVLVLPAHNSPFLGLHARIDDLYESHRRGLARLESLLTEPKRTIDVFESLFSRPITPGVLGMATGEAMAHLNYLWKIGRAIKTPDEFGVWWWRKPAIET
jgi:glyoxylase-like metal-dependent hydrolase (beta-lactamase superfamily II)